MRYLNAHEAAAEIGISRTHVLRLAQQLVIPSTRTMDGQVRIPEYAIAQARMRPDKRKFKSRPGVAQATSPAPSPAPSQPQ